MRLIGVYPSSRTACGGNMLRAVEDAIVELILDTWQPVQKVAADVRRLSHRFCFRGNLSLVTSAATGSSLFQRAVRLAPVGKLLANDDHESKRPTGCRFSKGRVANHRAPTMAASDSTWPNLKPFLRPGKNPENYRCHLRRK